MCRWPALARGPLLFLGCNSEQGASIGLCNFHVGKNGGSHGHAREGSNVMGFGASSGWIRDYRRAVPGSSCFARAALQLHSIKRRSRCTAVFPGVSVLSKPTPALSKCLKLQCRVTSQAGRRRFEPGLPLQLFNDLGTFKSLSVNAITALSSRSPRGAGWRVLQHPPATSQDPSRCPLFR